MRFFHISENNIISVKDAKVLWDTKFNCSPIGLTGLFIYSGSLPQAEPVPTGALYRVHPCGFALGRWPSKTGPTGPFSSTLYYSPIAKIYFHKAWHVIKCKSSLIFADELFPRTQKRELLFFFNKNLYPVDTQRVSQFFLQKIKYNRALQCSKALGRGRVCYKNKGH